jgi:hypothetical protein
LNAVIREVCLVQPNKQDKPNKPNEQERRADFFSILLKYEFDAEGPQMDIGLVCPIDGGVKIPGNRPRFIEPFLKRHI